MDSDKVIMTSQFIILVVFILKIINCANATIIYPGSFDPFYQTHYEEISKAITQLSDDEVVIYPISQAFQAEAISLFPHRLKIEIIKSYFPQNKNIKIENDLKVITKEVFYILDNIGKKHPNPKFLIGIDTLDIWLNLDGFEKFIEQNKLIVSLETNNGKLNAQIKEIFNERFSRYSNNINFMELTSNPLRQLGINIELQKTNYEILKQFTNQKTHELVKNNNEFEFQLENYIRISQNHLVTNINQNIVPLLKKHLNNAKFSNFIKKRTNLDQVIHILSQLNGKSMYEIGQVSWELFDLLRSNNIINKSEEIYNSFYTIMSSIFLLPTVQKLTSIYFIQNKMIKNYEMGKQQSLFQKNLNKALSKLQLLSWSFIWNSYKRLNNLAKSVGIKDRKTFNFMHNYIPLVHTNEVPLGHKIIVYRGMAQGSDLEKLKTDINNHGIISRIALNDYHQDGDKIKAIQASKNYFDQEKISSLVVNHIVGDWTNNTPFISTSFNKEVAIRSAGIGGIVFTIEVSLNQGYIANDPGYWIGYGDKNGINPNTRLSEFLIPHQIPAGAILKMEEVTEGDLPKQPLEGSFQATFRALKNIPWYINQCLRIFSK